jgi:hypothetical protein
MSEDSSDHVSLAAFTAVPRGAATDPAKKVWATIISHASQY